jgi:hypothetical protein|uniref:Uncharacterized protein n=1 Tax=viral metagenome TaxID=1070528 RepID=A0A6C0IS50_9ZZZZ
MFKYYFIFNTMEKDAIVIASLILYMIFIGICAYKCRSGNFKSYEPICKSCLINEGNNNYERV